MLKTELINPQFDFNPRQVQIGLFSWTLFRSIHNKFVTSFNKKFYRFEQLQCPANDYPSIIILSKLIGKINKHNRNQRSNAFLRRYNRQNVVFKTIMDTICGFGERLHFASAYSIHRSWLSKTTIQWQHFWQKIRKYYWLVFLYRRQIAFTYKLSVD